MTTAGEHIAMIDNAALTALAKDLIAEDDEFADRVAAVIALNGNVANDERFAWIAFLVGTLVSGEVRHGNKVTSALGEADDGQQQLVIDRLTARIMNIVGQDEMAELYLEDRAEYQRRCDAGRRFVDLIKEAGPPVDDA